MNTLLNDILRQCAHYTSEGAVANYIPELAKADPKKFGIYVITTFGQSFSAGDFDAKFTMQSVIKPLILLMALFDSGANAVHDLVGVEATGKPFDAFNYSDQALTSANINPMINTGAIALCTLIRGDTYAEKFDRLLNLAKKLAGNPDIDVDEDVYASEKATGSKNRALAYMLKSYGMLHDNVEDVLDCYFRACSISVTCENLANIGYTLAHRGQLPGSGEQVFPAHFSHYVNAILTTCGMYDGSGEFAIRVGVPAKSGVGGGIMAVVPSRMGIGIFAPALDAKGNSVAGTCMLEKLSNHLNLSIF